MLIDAHSFVISEKTDMFIPDCQGECQECCIKVGYLPVVTQSWGGQFFKKYHGIGAPKSKQGGIQRKPREDGNVGFKSSFFVICLLQGQTILTEGQLEWAWVSPVIVSPRFMLRLCSKDKCMFSGWMSERMNEWMNAHRNQVPARTVRSLVNWKVMGQAWWCDLYCHCSL
jgi:hypothetical protein